MGLIAEGIDDYEQLRSPQIGFVEYGVQEVRTQVETAKAQFDFVNARVKEASDLTTAQKDEWGRQYQAFNDFYDTTQGVSGAFNQFRDSTYKKTLAHQAVAEKYTKAFNLKPPPLPMAPSFKGAVKKTSQKSGTNINLPGLPNPSFNPSIGWDVPWMKILLWGGAGVGGYLLVKNLWHHSPQGKAVSFIAEPKEEKTE